MRKSPRIIYFIKAFSPDKDELEESYDYGTNVIFRNASLILENACGERCDGVAGSVPKSYEGIKTGKEAMEELKKRRLKIIKELK